MRLTFTFLQLSTVAFSMHMAEPELSSGKYYITSQWGNICSHPNGGWPVACPPHEQPTIWTYYCSPEGSCTLSTEKGSLQVDFNYKYGEGSRRLYVSAKGKPASIELKNLEKTEIGIKAMIRLCYDREFKCGLYLDADRHDTKRITAYKFRDYPQQYFTFRPAYSAPTVHKRNGMKANLEELVAASHAFEANIAPFPINTNTIEALSKEVTGDEFARDAEKAEIFMDASTYELLTKFLTYKKTHGNTVEKAVYAEIENSDAFIDRLIQKRPLAFYTKNDITLLRGSSSHMSMSSDWALVGQVDTDGNSKEGHIKMAEYLTYEEMELAALINICTATRFINTGNRHNNGRHEYHPPMPGYFLTGVGPRFEIPGRMEFRHMAVPRGEDIPNKLPTDQVSVMWQQYYGITMPLGEEDYEGKYVKLHIMAYKQRLRKTIYPILKQANRLGSDHGLPVVLRLVGFGLGVWAVPEVDQQKHFHQVVFDLVEENSLNSIKRIDMLWMGRDKSVVDLAEANGRNIQLVFSMGNPADPVGPGELLVATYAWDGNSFAGNEYWAHMLTASGDPAAASCSTIQEMQNPFINKCLTATNNLAVYA